MAAIPNIEDWLEISGLMFRQLMPNGDSAMYLGQTLSAEDRNSMVIRESVKVDHALVALATASGQEEVESLLQQLEQDTLIVLFSRWAQYKELWWKNQQPDWIPARSDEVWRAVFLSMAAGDHAQTAAQTLWPQAFGAPPGTA